MIPTNRPFTAATTKLAYTQAFSRDDMRQRRTSANSRHIRTFAATHWQRRTLKTASPDGSPSLHQS